MSFEFKFPDVGEGITEGTLVNWDVEVGQTIKEGDTVAHVETDKAVVEIPSASSGTVKELKANKGDTLEVGTTFMVIDDGSSQEESSKQEESFETKEEKVPSTDEKESDETSQNQQNVDGIKAMPAVFHEAKNRGIDLNTVTPSGKHGQILMEDLDGGKQQTSQKEEHPKKVESKEEVKEESSQSTTVSQDVLASLSVKKLARELGIDINFVVGSGDNGKITEEDVKRAKETKDKPGIHSQQEEDKQSQENTQNVEETTSTDENKSITLKGVRGTISKRMMESLSKTAQFTITDEVEVTDLVELKEEEKEILKEKGIKLSYLPFIIKAVKHACRSYPYFNGVFNEEQNTFNVSKSIDMGIAVDTPKGLMVPVIKEAQSQSIIELAQEIERVAKGAREQTLSAEELKGSTFTITSVGSIAGQAFTPIINYPEAAILGVGKIVDKPVVRDGLIVPGKVMTFSLTVDHRIVDGADAARFLKAVMEVIRDPHLLLLDS